MRWEILKSFVTIGSRLTIEHLTPSRYESELPQKDFQSSKHRRDNPYKFTVHTDI